MLRENKKGQAIESPVPRFFNLRYLWTGYLLPNPKNFLRLKPTAKSTEPARSKVDGSGVPVPVIVGGGRGATTNDVLSALYVTGENGFKEVLMVSHSTS